MAICYGCDSSSLDKTLCRASSPGFEFLSIDGKGSQSLNAGRRILLGLGVL